MHESLLTFSLLFGSVNGKLAGGTLGRAGPEWRAVCLSVCDFTLQMTRLTEKTDLITGSLTTELVE